jgi:YegS/Rv2252/BmrU family lipid kinase
MSFSLVVNPRAGAGRAERHLPRVLRALESAGARFEVLRTSRPGDATQLVREALLRGTEGVAVIGGDGTLNEATNGFFVDEKALRPDAWLAPLSCGTGGDFRKSIGSVNVARNGDGVEELVRRMLASTPRAIDVGALRFKTHEGGDASRIFLNITSFGVGGLVDQLVNDTPKWMGGGPAFFVGTLRALARYKPARVRLRIDHGAPIEEVITNIAVANGRFFGGGMHIAPNAELDDGHFDVITMRATPIVEALRLAPKLYRGAHLSAPSVAAARGRRVDAEPADPRTHVLLDVDGEAPGRLPASFEVLPRALRIRGG